MSGELGTTWNIMNNTPGGSTTKRYNVEFNDVNLYFTILGNLRIPEKQEQSRQKVEDVESTCRSLSLESSA